MSTQPDSAQPVIITAARLSTFLRDKEQVSAEATLVAEDQALGWLSDAIEADKHFDWAAHKNDRSIKAWVLELAAISYENPTSMASDGSGDINSTWLDRRSQILDAARAWAKRNDVIPPPAAKVARSLGCFPPAPTGPRFDRPTQW